MGEPVYLTKEKYAELEKELEHLRTTRRKEVAEHLEYSKSLGDLAENAEYQEARSEQANIEDRIGRLDAMLKSAVLREMRHTEAVGVGSTVWLAREGAKERAKYTIVGSEEADLAKGKLSLSAPLGQAMIGKRKGESFVAKTPGGEAKYKIADIE